ncbi:MAG: STAS domain-containing protein [Nocardioides sp.]|uniref:STAS domain-containing protein n=1 Tax=Nocardioides sp. TaxID=35761 RepID=UPI003263E12B
MSDLVSIESIGIEDGQLVRAIGEIDLSNVAEVLSAVISAVPHDAALVVLDLSDVTYLDSAGISMLFKLAERLGYSRQPLRLVVPPDSPIRAVLELTNLTSVIPVVESIRS